jgi:hypothetical protein
VAVGHDQQLRGLGEYRDDKRAGRSRPSRRGRRRAG